MRQRSWADAYKTYETHVRKREQFWLDRGVDDRTAYWQVAWERGWRYANAKRGGATYAELARAEGISATQIMHCIRRANEQPPPVMREFLPVGFTAGDIAWLNRLCKQRRFEDAVRQWNEGRP